MKQPALFLDRDGTLVHAVHYPSRPEQLRLYDGIGPELRMLQRIGFRLIVITNQAGIARGYFTETDLQHMHQYLRQELNVLGVHLDAIYHCPHHPEGVIEPLAIRCECRKPRPGMLLRAAADLNLDLSRSWFLGDILDDIEAGNRAGCRTVLIDLDTESKPNSFLRIPTFVARNTLHALQIVQTVSGNEQPLADVPTTRRVCGILNGMENEKALSCDLAYRPASWSISDSTPHHPTSGVGCDNRN